MPDAPDPPAEGAPPSPPDLPTPRWRLRIAVVALSLASGLLVAMVVRALVDDDGSTRSADERTMDTGSTDAPDPPTTEASVPGTSEADDDEIDETPSAAPTTGSGTGAAGSFPDGRWTVGSDLEPGRYIATGIVDDGCDWTRLAGTTGDDVIVAEDHVAGQAIVDIPASDTAFRSTGCGTWTLYTPPDPPPLAAIDQGDWVVGEQIQPGAYQAPRTTTCHWTTASGFGHTTNEVIQTDTSALSLEGPMHTQLTAGQRFTTQGCGTWQRSD